MSLFHGEDNEKRENKSKSSSRDDIPPEYLGSVLRAEIMPADEASPDRPDFVSLYHRLDIRRIGLIVLILVIIGSTVICLVGPGKQLLENSLMSLIGRKLEPTPMNTSTSSPALLETPQVSTTSTLQPTKTSTRIPPTITSTRLPTETLREEDGCVDPLGITLDDVGKTLCVGGIIVGMEEREVGFIVYFSNERGVFYLITYDFKWDQAEEGDCIQVTGEIQQLGNTPVLVFGWNNLPQMCP